jgi:hypothetical protein
VTTEHKEIEITYLEDSNQWRFTLRGLERTVDSLKKAKEAIDAPPPMDKKPFKRVEVWKDGGVGFLNLTGGFQKFTVTSLVEPSRYFPRTRARISDSKKSEPHELSKLYAVTPHNDNAINQIRVMREEIESLEKKVRETIERLTPFIIPKDTE